MRLRFYTPGQESAESIEPGPFFRLIGGMLCRGAVNEPVATWLGDWHLADTRFARVETLDPVVLYFESNAGLASSAFGPFESFQVSAAASAGERAASAAAGEAAAMSLAACAGSRLLARLDERSLLWYPPRAQDGWAAVLIAPPGRSRFDLMRERPLQSPAVPST
ncbi:MAG TPA: hypothetical protein VEV18_05085 [Steroidobacteraceae bacterium]|nr:hypothetical protein [Steroidobacteraceae bacterium]